jgi:hypothetical protein
MEYLFIMGTPRSGTTAMANLLNKHSRIIVGRERFVKHKQPTRAHFEPDHFFNPTDDDANNMHPALYQQLREKYKGGIDWIGDKVPFYTRQLAFLTGEFPGAKMVFLLRNLNDVASSYQRRFDNPDDHWRLNYRTAVRGWNENLGHALRYLSSDRDCEMLVVSYERFFSGDISQLRAVLGFLDLTEEPSLTKAFQARTAGWGSRQVGEGKGLSESQRAWVESQRSAILEAGLRAIADAQVEQWEPRCSPSP